MMKQDAIWQKYLPGPKYIILDNSAPFPHMKIKFRVATRSQNVRLKLRPNLYKQFGYQRQPFLFQPFRHFFPAVVVMAITSTHHAR